jgi:hypothetical protein
MRWFVVRAFAEIIPSSQLNWYIVNRNFELDFRERGRCQNFPMQLVTQHCKVTQPLWLFDVLQLQCDSLSF